MDYQFIINLIIILIIFCFYVLLSFTEKLLYVITKEERDIVIKQKDWLFKWEWLVENFKSISMLIWWLGAFSRILIFVLLVILFDGILEYFILSPIISLVIFLIMTEYVSLLIPVNIDSTFYTKTIHITQLIITFLVPISYIVSKIDSHLPKGLNEENRKPKKNIRELLRIATKEGMLDRQEILLLENIIDFSEQDVRQIMTPRNKIVAVNHDMKLERILYEIKRKLVSKIIIYTGDMDNIIGYIKLNELLPYFLKYRKSNSIDPLIHKVHFVPETKTLIDLMIELKKLKLNTAVVIDEYGGTSGLVTLTDLVIKIFGKYIDEFQTSVRLINKISENKYYVDGETLISDFSKELDIEIDVEDSNTETIAGFLIYKFNKIPKQGSEYHIKDYKFIVQNVNETKINSVLVVKE